jgi:hypothetical protein
MKENTSCVCSLVHLWVGGHQKTALHRDVNLDPLVVLLSAEESATGGAHATASSVGSENVRRRLCGIEILIALVEAGYPLFVSSDYSALGSRILDLIASGCKFARKEVSEQSAKAAGVIMKSLTQSIQSSVMTCENYMSIVESKIISLLGTKNGVEDAFACVRAVCRQHSPFLSREMVLKLFMYFNKAKPRGKVDMLEILCLSSSTIASYQDIHIIDYLEPYLASLLLDVSTIAFGRGINTVRLPMIQILTMRLLRLYSAECCRNQNALSIVLLGSSKDTLLDQVFGLELILRHSSAVEVRMEAYDMLMVFHSKLCQEVDNGNILYVQYLKVVRVILLRGLTDPDDRGMYDAVTVDNEPSEYTPGKSNTNEDSLSTANKEVLGIRRKVYDFFNLSFGLSICPITRLHNLMTDLFVPSVSVDAGNSSAISMMGSLADQWLMYSSYLILASPQRTRETQLQSRGLTDMSNSTQMLKVRRHDS